MPIHLYPNRVQDIDFLATGLKHKEIAEAKKGMEIGMKVDNPVKEGFEVYKA